MNEAFREEFLKLRGHLKIVHHVSGRVRLRIAAGLFKDIGSVDKIKLNRIMEAIDGIKQIRINKAAATIVIYYASDVLKPAWWDALVQGDEHTAVELFDQLMTTNLAPAIEATREN